MFTVFVFSREKRVQTNREEDQASAWQSKLAQEREASAVEPASIVYVSVLSPILKAAEEESLDRSISELESEVSGSGFSVSFPFDSCSALWTLEPTLTTLKGQSPTCGT